MQKAANVYMQTKVSTTDQGQLLLMLYDGALTFLAQARDKMIARDFAAKGQLISKAIDIVNELASSLNLEKGGSLAENLNNLYFLCTARLLQANLKMNVEQLDSVVQILSSLRGAYAQIIDKPEAREAVKQIGARILPEVSNNQRTLTTPAPTTAAPMGQLQAKAAYQMAAARMQTMSAAPASAPASASAVAPAAPATPAPAAVQPAAQAAAPAQAHPATPAQHTAPAAPPAAYATPAQPGVSAQPVATPQPQAAVKIPYASAGAQPPAAASVASAAPAETASTPAAPPLPAASRIAFNKKLAAYGKMAS